MISLAPFHHFAFNRAIELARIASESDEVPVGAVVMERATGRVIAEAHNEVEQLRDSTAHAELLALRRAAATLKSPKLDGCDLIVTLEPCAMCASAIAQARIHTLIYGAYDPKSGGVEHGARVFSHTTCHHKPEIVGGVREAECAALMRNFFEGKR